MGQTSFRERYPPPWRVDEIAGGFSVVAANGQLAELLVTVFPGPDSQGVPFETETFTPESWAAIQPG